MVNGHWTACNFAFPADAMALFPCLPPGDYVLGETNGILLSIAAGTPDYVAGSFHLTGASGF